MKFVVLIYQDERIWQEATQQQQEQYYVEHAAFAEAIPLRGVTLLAAEALTSVASATSVRRRGSAVTVTDGPFAETAEQLGGFYLVEAPDLDVVTELVALLPEYTVEIRPVANM